MDNDSNFKNWFDAIWLGDEEHGQFIPNQKDEDYAEYLEQYTLAHGAYKYALSHSKERIAELEAEVKRLHTGDNLKALLNEDTDIWMQNCLEMNKTIKAKDERIAELEKDVERYCKLKSLALTAQTSKTFAISKFEENYWSAYELSPIDLDEELDKINYSNSTDKAKQLASDALAMKGSNDDK